MKKLIFASHNPHKVTEIKELFKQNPVLKTSFSVVGLSEIGFLNEIPETASTLQGNAFLKAHAIYEKFQSDCFADDTGLEVAALNNTPGVYSARYANMPDDFEQSGRASPLSLEQADPTFQQNIDRLLNKLQKVKPKDRTARFRTVVCLILKGETYYFEGVLQGEILSQRQGGNGFGYDPIFRPKGYQETLAELSIDEKNKISHRGQAIAKLTSFLCV
ncbi:MAG: RdgB/HAM1 family non-canonical purine NTP pyrophosphatase [Bacteroidales bacterium]